jgi:hypothetical protein
MASWMLSIYRLIEELVEKADQTGENAADCD